MDLDTVFVVEMLREAFSTIDGTVLPAGTTESNLQMGEVALDEPRHMMIDKGIDGFEEGQNLAILFEEVNDGLIQAGEGLVLLILARVMGSAAVKDIPAAITAVIDRQPAFKREGVNRY